MTSGHIFRFKVLCGVAAILCVMTSVVSSQSEDEDEEEEKTEEEGKTDSYEVCKSPVCQEAAQFYKAAMDTSIDPCTDFFQFSCGGWLKANPMPPGRNMWSVSLIMNQDIDNKTLAQLKSDDEEDATGTVHYAKKLFKSCLSSEHVEKDDCIKSLLDGLDVIGGFPLLGKERYNGTWTWAQKLASLVREFGYSYIMDLDVRQFNKHNVIHLKPVIRFGLDTVVLLRPENHTTQITAYKYYIMRVVCFLRKGCKKEELPDIESQIDDVVKFESSLVKEMTDNVKKDEEDDLFLKKILSRVMESVPNIPWMEYINHIFEDADIEVTIRTKVAIRKEKHFLRIGLLMKEAKLETVANYVSWRFLQTIGPYSCRSMKYLEFEFKKKYKNLTEPVSYPTQCLKLTKNYFDLAVGRLYIENHFTKETMDEMFSMIQTITLAFKKLLKENTWMDDATKEKAERKIDLMQQNVGYPFWIMNERKLDKFYPLPKNPFNSSNFVENLRELMKYRTNEDIDKLTQAPCDSERWKNNPAEVNAYYSAYLNTMKFPAGYLIAPNYWASDETGLTSINYGAIGNTIGHEMTHGFDNRGSQYDGYGNFENWWSESTLEEFLKRKECFVKQYTDIVDPTTKMHLNGKETIADDIADNGGVREAYVGYMLTEPKDIRFPGLEEFDDKKMHFIAMACTYCTNFKPAYLAHKIRRSKHTADMYRVNIPLQNFKVFAEVFQCPAGSPMNPEERCVLW